VADCTELVTAFVVGSTRDSVLAWYATAHTAVGAIARPYASPPLRSITAWIRTPWLGEGDGAVDVVGAAWSASVQPASSRQRIRMGTDRGVLIGSS